MKKRLTIEEGIRLLNEYGTPQHVIEHCIAVTDVATKLGKALNEVGFDIDIRLLQGAGIIHDIARTEEKHWEKGSQIAKKLGYSDESEIIAVHMFYPEFSPIDNVNETDLVCLGDRLVKENKYVGLDERINYVIDKAKKKGADETVIERILEKKENARLFIEGIEKVTGKKIDEIVSK